MTGDDAAFAVLDALEAAGIPYMLVGSYSTNAYGVPRATQDADIVIELGSHSIWELVNRLGPEFHFDPQMTFETVTMTRRHTLQVVGMRFKIELFHLSDDLHDQERFRRRRRFQLPDRQVVLPTVEDVLVTKLRWTVEGKRTKDWEDIRDVITVQGHRIDWDYVYRWAEQHGTRATLDEIRQSIPPLS
jgi:hypothetical protein